jgi:hypothetical protein
MKNYPETKMFPSAIEMVSPRDGEPAVWETTRAVAREPGRYWHTLVDGDPQPCFGVPPVLVSCRRGDAQYFGGEPIRQACKKSEFDQFRTPRVGSFQLLKSVVKREEVEWIAVSCVFTRQQTELKEFARPLLRMNALRYSSSGAFNQNSPHRERGGAKKMTFAVPT